MRRLYWLLAKERN